MTRLAVVAFLTGVTGGRGRTRDLASFCPQIVRKRQPGVYRSVQERDELARRVYMLEEIEEFAAREYGLDLAS